MTGIMGMVGLFSMVGDGRHGCLGVSRGDVELEVGGVVDDNLSIELQIEIELKFELGSVSVVLNGLNVGIDSEV